jgi:Tfp pilus assembly protein PilF
VLRSLLEGANRALERDTGDSSVAIGERQSSRGHAAAAHYLAGLAHLGLGDTEDAKQEFTLALQASPDQLGVKAALAQLH